METRIFIVEVPTLSSLVDEIGNFIDEAVNKVFPKREKSSFDEDEDLDDDWLADEPIGTPRDMNKRFGAGFEIDEPRREDYDKRWQFESDHAAFDRFVDAGEDCVARGLEKKSNAPIHKCQAIRKRVGEMPPTGIDIIGETHWYDEPMYDDDDDWWL